METREFNVDLHIHTALSPCASGEMTPEEIVGRALEKELSIIGITDHNSAGNVGAVWESAKGTKLVVIPGMEVETREEIHVICLFNTLNAALEMQEFVYTHLPSIPNKPDIFGEQVLFESSAKKKTCERMLLTSTALPVEEVVSKVKKMDGIYIFAHVDRPSYSIISQLLFIPENLQDAAVEISPKANPQEVKEKYPSVRKMAMIKSSDAHRPTDIGTGGTIICMKEPGFRFLQEVLTGKQNNNIIFK